MHVTEIEKIGHKFEREGEQRGLYGKFWRKETEEEIDAIIL